MIDPNQKFPMQNVTRLCFLKNIINQSNIIVGGNPATVIRKRFDDKTIELLLKIKWWDWDFEKITKYTKDIATGNKDFLLEMSKSHD